MNYKKMVLKLATVCTLIYNVNSSAANKPIKCASIATTMFSALALSAYKYFDDLKYYDTKLTITKISSITLGSGLLCSKFCSWYFSPEKYLSSAKTKIAQRKWFMDFLERYENIDQRFLEDIIEGYSHCRFPYVTANNTIVYLIDDSEEIVKWLNIVINSDESDKEIREQAKNIIKRFNSLYFEKLYMALEKIRQHPDYFWQISKLNQENINSAIMMNQLQNNQRIFSSCRT